jgi:hypothetical protein
MSQFTRRDALKLGVGASAAADLGPLIGDITPATAQDFTPEPGASLRLLRFSPFVKGEDEAWVANTKRFTEKTGVEVRIERESNEDIRPKAAVAAKVGSGPDSELARARTFVSTGLTEIAATSTRRSCPFAVGLSISMSTNASARSMVPRVLYPMAFMALFPYGRLIWAKPAPMLELINTHKERT